jgi:hypothetical protein
MGSQWGEVSSKWGVNGEWFLANGESMGSGFQQMGSQWGVVFSKWGVNGEWFSANGESMGSGF